MYNVYCFLILVSYLILKLKGKWLLLYLYLSIVDDLDLPYNVLLYYILILKLHE